MKYSLILTKMRKGIRVYKRRFADLMMRISVLSGTRAIKFCHRPVYGFNRIYNQKSASLVSRFGTCCTPGDAAAKWRSMALAKLAHKGLDALPALEIISVFGVGYDGASSFSKAFKRERGTAPAAYRAAHS